MGDRINSRRKGVVGERELAKRLTSEGFDARRGRQFRGGPDSPDVICEDLPDIHWEVKRVERLHLENSLAQAVSEAPDGSVPVVAHRKNNAEWVAILRLDDFLQIVRESEYAGGNE